MVSLSKCESTCEFTILGELIIYSKLIYQKVVSIINKGFQFITIRVAEMIYTNHNSTYID